MIKLFIRFGAPYMDGSCQVIGRTLKPSEGSSAQTEGYFCTVDELRELFEESRQEFVFKPESILELKAPRFKDFDQWLKSKEAPQNEKAE